MAVIKNAKIFDGEKMLGQTAVVFENGKVTGFLDSSDCADAIDAGGKLVTPGLVDIHIHGSFGIDFMEKGALETVCKKLPQYGVTSLLATSVTESDRAIRDFLGYTRKAMKMEKGTRILGAHLEGPYFSYENRGAHDENELRDPLPENYHAMTDGFEDIITRVSIAPEKKGGFELVKELVEDGVLVSVAHTNANADEMEKAIDLGLSLCTHTFNGMFPFHHRNTGSIGVVLTDDRITCEFIPDLHHITKLAIRLILKSKGTENTIICTDAIAGALVEDGDYVLGGLAVVVKDSVAHLKSDGRLAGSTISLDWGVRNLVNEVGVPVETALRMATRNPAKAIGRDHQVGRLAVGSNADILVLNDDLTVERTFIRGVEEYHRV
ncbi:MAG TPA: N-acetylglucosamine-6-phosphate deacetylase [Clostridia bacterium]|nr:N-acetylglucosamine-6-phosphate deacetylase [Clostridia bacterium]